MNLVRVYLVSAHGLGRFAMLARGLFEGLWLGVLERRHLARIDEIYFRGAGQYLDEAYNHRGLWPWEERALTEHFAEASRVVVTAAGGGREVIALLARGLDATGYEPHPALAEFGSGLTTAAGHGRRVLPSRRDEWPDAPPGTDGVIVGWGSYMLIVGRRRRIAFLQTAAAAVPPGTPVLLSFFVRDSFRLRWWTSAILANGVRRLRRAAPVEIGDALDPNYVHFFTRDEVQSELSDAGLDMVDFGADDYGWAVARVRGAGHREPTA